MHKPGIEPGSIAWQATILPLDHLCVQLIYHLFSFILYILLLKEEIQVFFKRKNNFIYLS